MKRKSPKDKKGPGPAEPEKDKGTNESARASDAAEVMDSSEAVAQVEEDLSGKSEGAAYFGRRRVQKQVEQEVEERTKEVFRQAFQLAGEHAVEVSVDKLKDTGDGMRMVANLSCLVEEGQEEGLRAAFEEYCAGDGLAVRFAGPLPPYSFV